MLIFIRKYTSFSYSSIASVRKTIFIILLLSVFVSKASAQFSYGTTGLLDMPTAEMQSDKTFMFGGSYLEKHATPARWTYNTFNYYVNITILPWIEISYTLTLHKSLENDPVYGKGFWVPGTYGKFTNQDREVNIRLRAWKEGQWKWWTPQIVLGSTDFLHSWSSKSKLALSTNEGNGFYSRLYIAATKHFEFQGIGELGAHIAYLWNQRVDWSFNAPAFGANMRFSLNPQEGNIPWWKIVNGMNLMAEFTPANNGGVNLVSKVSDIPAGRGLHLGIYDINVGGSYTFWQDHVNLYAELYGCRYFSGGLQFKIHLR